MTTVRLAYGGAAKIIARALNDAENMPAMLVSYFYMRGFIKQARELKIRDWVLDSGAFSADSVGAVIDNDAYAETARELLATDPRLKEVFALDVIGDSEATMRNTAKLWEKGIEAIPTFHVGGKLSTLQDMAREFPKIALGGAVGYGKKNAWAASCFKAIWPKKIHGFGFGSRKAILMLPWHSVDASNWMRQPQGFGRCNGAATRRIGEGVSARRFSRKKVPDTCVRGEVDYYLRLERQAKHRWRKQMALLEELDK